MKITASRTLRLRVGVVLGFVAAAAVGLTLAQLTMTAPSTQTPSATSAPPAAPTVPPAVQAYADRVVPSFSGIVRIDRKAIVRVGGVLDRDVAIPGVTTGTWAVVVAGDIRQTRGLLPHPNFECAIFFVTYLGDVFASQGSTLRTCEKYFAAVPTR
jgi:hypothetical protein